jgi:hypothetical protein
VSPAPKVRKQQFNCPCEWRTPLPHGHAERPDMGRARVAKIPAHVYPGQNGGTARARAVDISRLIKITWGDELSQKRDFQKVYYYVVAAVFGLVLAVPMAYFGYRELAPNPLAGECVKQVNHGAADLTFEEVSCSAAGRSSRSTGREFEVGAIASTCPPGDYTAVPRDDEKTCYLPSLNVGPCFVAKQFKNTSQPVFVRGDCKEPGARKVDENIQDVSDRSKCKNPEISLTFSEPARTVCMVKP